MASDLTTTHKKHPELSKKHAMAPQDYEPPSSGEIPFTFPPYSSYPWSWNPYPTVDYFPPPPPLSSSSGGGGGGGGGISRTSIVTPAIVASVALLGSAILLVSYYRVFAKYCSAWQIFWGLSGRGGGGGHHRDRDDTLHGSSVEDVEQGWLLARNTGLDESIVRKIPVYVYRVGGGGVVDGSVECVVCLGEFEEDDELRILPKCSHAFHLSCIDVWLRSHSNCPLCRAPVVVPPDHHPQQHPIAPLLITPPIQTMGDRGGGGGEGRHHRSMEEAAHCHRSGMDEEEQWLPRSRSLQLDQRRRKPAIPPPLLRRSHSAGANPVSYHDLMLVLAPPPLSSPLPPPPSHLHDSSSLVAPNNSAELSTVLCSLREDQRDPEYVVLDFEVVEEPCSSRDEKIGVSGYAASSSSSSSSSDHSGCSSSRPLLWVRKSGSFKASFKRSLSAGRVFSFASFSRSRSQSQP